MHDFFFFVGGHLGGGTPPPPVATPLQPCQQKNCISNCLIEIFNEKYHIFKHISPNDIKLLNNDEHKCYKFLKVSSL